MEDYGDGWYVQAHEFDELFKRFQLALLERNLANDALSQREARIAELERDASRWRLVESRRYEVYAYVEKWGGLRRERQTTESIDAEIAALAGEQRE
jgi:hypothetical protein